MHDTALCVLIASLACSGLNIYLNCEVEDGITKVDKKLIPLFQAVLPLREAHQGF